MADLDTYDSEHRGGYEGMSHQQGTTMDVDYLPASISDLVHRPSKPPSLTATYPDDRDRDYNRDRDRSRSPVGDRDRDGDARIRDEPMNGRDNR